MYILTADMTISKLLIRKKGYVVYMQNLTDNDGLLLISFVLCFSSLLNFLCYDKHLVREGGGKGKGHHASKCRIVSF